MTESAKEMKLLTLHVAGNKPTGKTPQKHEAVLKSIKTPETERKRELQNWSLPPQPERYIKYHDNDPY